MSPMIHIAFLPRGSWLNFIEKKKRQKGFVVAPSEPGAAVKPTAGVSASCGLTSKNRGVTNRD